MISIDASDDTHFPYSCTIFRACLGHCYGSHVGFEWVLEDVCIYGAFCQSCQREWPAVCEVSVSSDWRRRLDWSLEAVHIYC